VRANKLLLLVASLASLGLLVGAALEENVFRPWRVLQREYRSRLGGPAGSAFRVQLRQVVVPSLRATDRCISCHVGMVPGEAPISGHRVFGSHPDVVHDPGEFGCTVCHGGQGRATAEADAHGQVPYWPQPMIPRRYAYAGCGTCHTHLAVPNLGELERGRAAFERLDCLACHRLEGRGGTLRPGSTVVAGPDLSRVGASGYDPAWYDRHLERSRAEKAGGWAEAFGPIGAQDLEALRVFLGSRVGAPGLVEAKALFHSLGCRGCHKVGGVGGDDGPDLTTVGQKDPGRLDFSRVPGERSLSAWFAEHFRSPAAVVPGSLMPVLGLSEADIAQLVFYLLSLRRSEVPEALWPKDRIRAERFGEREFATDGATLYGTFCAACHGPKGEGMRYPGMPPFPAIGNPDFLALASDAFIAETVRRGRPGRRMPAWGEKEGGLRPEEIRAVVEYVRGLGGGVAPAPDPRGDRWLAADPREGERLYGAYCASCHGTNGEGREGPSLNHPVFLAAASDTYLVETIRRGRRGTSMPGFGLPSPANPQLADHEIEAIASFVRSWEEKR